MRLLIILIVTLTSCSSAKTQNKIGENLPDEFLQRWKLDYGELNGQRIEGLPQSPEQDHEFRSDFTYVIYSQSEDNYIGQWAYDKELTIVLLNGGQSGKIIDISKTGFTLIPPKDKLPPHLQDMRYYFIPKQN